jgi:hypothetical protein
LWASGFDNDNRLGYLGLDFYGFGFTVLQFGLRFNPRHSALNLTLNRKP